MMASIAKRALSLGLMLGATAAVAATLPLRPGTYVMVGASCHDPAFAAMFRYDGQRFSYPHATKCRSVIQSRAGNSYRVEETCAALGDGSATAPTTMNATYTITSLTHVVVAQGWAGAGRSYRWCPSPQ